MYVVVDKSACLLSDYLVDQRYQALQRYHISKAIAFGPYLIYTSLILFCVGLVEFLWHLHYPFVVGLCGLAATFLTAMVLRAAHRSLNAWSRSVSFTWATVRRFATPRQTTPQYDGVEELGGIKEELDVGILDWLSENGRRDDVRATAKRLRVKREPLSSIKKEL